MIDSTSCRRDHNQCAEHEEGRSKGGSPSPALEVCPRYSEQQGFYPRLLDILRASRPSHATYTWPSFPALELVWHRSASHRSLRILSTAQTSKSLQRSSQPSTPSFEPLRIPWHRGKGSEDERTHACRRWTARRPWLEVEEASCLVSEASAEVGVAKRR